MAISDTAPELIASRAPSVKPQRRPIRAIRSEAGIVIVMMPTWFSTNGSVASVLSTPRSA
jgi:hypothetical protein